MRRTNKHFTYHRVRWTPLELGLVAVALLLLGGSFAVELYSWTHPRVAPAAPRANQEVTTAISEPSPESLVEAPTATETPTENPPIATPESIQPTSTSVHEPPVDNPADTPVPTNTELPTQTPWPTVTPFPTPVVVDPPLTLEQSASVDTATMNQEFFFVLTIGTSSDSPRTVEVRDTIAAQLEILGASASSGSCGTSNPVTCTVGVQRGQPAVIQISVRVRGSMSPGTRTVTQALARDDLRTTAASNQVIVLLTGPAPQGVVSVQEPTIPPTTPTNGITATPAPPSADINAPQEDANTSETADATAVVVGQVATATPTAAVTTTAGAAATSIPPTPARTAAAATTRIPATPSPALPPTLVPTNQAGSPSSPSLPPKTPELPRTTTTTSSFGLGLGLLGMALTLHATRRVRRADAKLTEQGDNLHNLAPLLDNVAHLQQSTVSEIAHMQARSQEMIDIITSKQRK